MSSIFSIGHGSTINHNLPSVRIATIVMEWVNKLEELGKEPPRESPVPKTVHLLKKLWLREIFISQ